MSDMQANISIPVDLTNPGQFFACCGLLELASRIDRGAEGWFSDGKFHIADADSHTVERFLECNVTSDNQGTGNENQTGEDDHDKKSSMRLGDPFNLTLDWWRDDNPDQNAIEAKLKTWSAGQKVSDVFDNTSSIKTKKASCTNICHGLRGWMSQVVKERPTDWLRATIPISKPKAFCYDSRLSRNNALDQGHTAGGIMAFSPAVDVLSLVGLQRFRPWTLATWQCNQYCVWSVPLPVTIAPVVVLGFIPHLIVDCFQFPIIRRDSAGKYKLVGHAQSIRRPHV